MKKTLYITATLPALTVTFIYREIFRLQAIGMNIGTVSMNTPSASEVSQEARPLLASTVYLDQAGIAAKLTGFVLHAVLHPIRLAKCCAAFVTAKPMQSMRDYARLAYHLFEAGYLARRLQAEGYEHIHCHFVNGPTSIGMFLAKFLDIPYSFTMHASMIWLDPIAIRNKLDSCQFCVSISEYNKRYVVQEYGAKYGEKIHIVHCGIDPESDSVAANDDRSSDVLQILSVGQLNPRKGLHVLIQACKILRSREIRFQCTIVGEGAQREQLESAIDSGQLSDSINLAGAIPHEQVGRHLRNCDVFVLPCVVSNDGWRDGIPVALMEAMLYYRPVVSTNILGLPELIDDGVNGLLVEANDQEALAEAIERLSLDPSLCKNLGAKGHKKVLEEFNNNLSAEQLSLLFAKS